ncbi:hypothetical protein SU48_00370 [Deinococcus puniceus]|uniref:Uncharacterized protein n=1 Tax=Deinococcus puniceus TaxID=1182568 RepID=A0A172T665_9DEIO|nr:hypothetical protein SU48_00370 [Deinococcus puniceus]
MPPERFYGTEAEQDSRSTISSYILKPRAIQSGCAVQLPKNKGRIDAKLFTGNHEFLWPPMTNGGRESEGLSGFSGKKEFKVA